MSEQQIVVELRLIEQNFRINTTEAERPELERAAEFFNQKFHELRRNAPRIEHNRLVIMVALQMAQEILTLKKSTQQYKRCEQLLQTILEDTEYMVTER